PPPESTPFPYTTLFRSSIEHNYTSTYSVGNFTSSLNYEEMYVNLAVTGYLMASNLVNDNPLYSHVNEYGHYIPVFAMTTITMARSEEHTLNSSHVKISY